VEPSTIIHAVAIGFAAGLLSGAFGIGGGILSTPLLRMFLDVTPHESVGTTLAVIIPTAVSGAVNYVKKKLVIKELAIYCGISAIFGTTLGSAATRFIEGQHLMIALAILMVIVGLDFITGFGAKLKKSSETNPEQVEVLDRGGRNTAIVLGFMVGIMSGVLGVGGGFVMIPAFCYFFHTPIKVAFGTSLLVVAVVAVPGTIVHAFHDHVEWGISLSMLFGSVPGAWIGSYFSLRAKDQWLKITFGCILLGLATLFAYRELTIK
jgi:uncharacterized protein